MTKKRFTQQQATYLALTGAFSGIFVLFNLFGARPRQATKADALDLVQLGLATYRLGRLVAYDKVFEPERLPFAKTVPDPTGAGDTTAPRGAGITRALGELITCPICAGTWIAAGLVYGLNAFPQPTRILLNIMSAVGLAEVLNAATEALDWLGQAARERAGTEHIDKTLR